VATLHVRNVPEPLYELLRECAETEGRSIGAQAIAFIQQGVMPRASRRAFPRRRRGAFQRFTTPARQVIVRAQEEARAAGAPAVEPSHVVLALLAHGGAAADALASLGVDADTIRAGLARGPGSPPQIPFSADTKRVLEHALRESLGLRHEWIGNEHLLLALASDQLFADVGGEEAVRSSVMQAFARAPAVPWPPPDDRQYLAVDLAGDADDWTTRLNDLAGEGWELMQIVTGRAVLRRANG
jgi:hypothetical protein